MQAGAILRFLLIGALGLLVYRLFFSSDQSSAQGQPTKPEPTITPATRAPYSYCAITTDDFSARLVSRGAVLRDFKLLRPKYSKQGAPIDLSTTPHPGVALGSPRAEDPTAPGLHEFRQQLFTTWRNPESNAPADTAWNVAFDSVDYTLASSDGKSCVFSYKDGDVELTKRIAATERAYELEVTNQIKNLAAERKSHAFAVDTVAWWTTASVSGKMFSVNPFMTHVECIPQQGNAVRLLPDAFEPGDFSDTDEYEVIKPWGWYRTRSEPAVAAVANAYFAHAIVPISGPSKPHCSLLIENFYRDGKSSDPASGHFYRARLGYALNTLGPGESASYVDLTYIGPKERSVLEAAGGGKHRLSELIDLGFFAGIAKVLVAFLLAVHGVVPNWGIAIIVLTITARVLLFPLSWPSIKNMVRMRELKPEMDAMNEKFKADPQAKGLAQMELWRKHKVNPLKGCLPQIASMPVWFALYTTLQTAVELFNIPFLWFPDLSEPDPYFILPLIIGATYYLQQKLMPMQGGDPAQQKMMMYFMPAMFTVFMLFLPAGLGVYMFTNSVLVMAQQALVELHVKKTMGKGSPPGVITTTGEATSDAPRRGRGGKKDKLADSSGPLLDKGKV
jgi:YidC/Oxa1 family membrane protein insertase